LGSIDVAQLLNQWNSQPAAGSEVVVSATPNPVYQQAPDAQGNRWTTTITLTDEAGLGTTLTSFAINGANRDVISTFGSAAMPAQGSLTAIVKFTDLSVPAVMVFGFTGMDASGQAWTRQISIPFETASTPISISAVTNAASHDQAFAPGMLLYVTGSQLSPIVQVASSVPLSMSMSMGEVSASINGLAAPLYYVSPGALYIQIPYEVPPGNATLRVLSEGQVAIFSFTVRAAAPGIFTAMDGSLIPLAHGARGDTLSLCITGQGAVSPAVATGDAPSAATALSHLPAPTLPVSLTIGGVPAPLIFIGVPPGVVGVTLINFQIPLDAPLGPQPVVVTVGDVPSAPATLTVTK
jgi:uncharacterized protein (TIGR03437 family)